MLQILLLAAAYVAAGALGLWWAVLNDHVSPVWPPTGLAIAALLVFGRRLWPGVFIGAFIVNLWPGTPLVALGIAVGNTLEAYVAALLVQRFAGGMHAFSNPQDSFKFVLLAAVASTAISASIGVATLLTAGSIPADTALEAWITWWLGDMISAVTIGPLLLVLRTKPELRWTPTRIAEALGLLATLILIALLVFGDWPLPGRPHDPLSFLVLPPLLWAAYRYGPHGAVMASFLLSFIALLATRAGLGPFAISELNTSLLLLQSFIGTAMFSALVLAAVVQQERDHKQALNAQAGLLRAQSEASPDGYLMVSPNGKMLAFNQRFVDMWGFSEDIIASRSDEAALNAAREQLVDPDAFMARVKYLYTHTDEASHDEMLFKDGRVFERHGVPAKTADGRYLGFVWYFRDISQRKRTENELREKEAHIRLLLNSTGEAIFGVDRDGRCTFVNAACLALLGYDDERDLLGQNIHARTHRARVDGTACSEPTCPIYRPLSSGKAVHRQEEQLWRADSSDFPAEYSAYPIHQGEAIVGTVVTFVDIAERKRARNALRAAEARLRAVISSLPAILFALDNDGVITLAEGKGLESLGYKPGDLVGKSAFDVYYDGTPEAINNIKRALAGDSVSDTVEMRGVWLERHFAPLYDEKGVLRGTSGVSLDVTQQRRAEEELFRASKLESIGVLAGGIAHDFNNILTAIGGNLALARMYGTDDNVMKCVAESEKAALRARGLTQQLLAFSKGGQPIKKIFSLAALLPAAAEFALQGSNVRAKVEVAAGLWPIEGDEGQLNQVINNLVLNAQQAMPHGGTVHIDLQNVTATGGPLTAGEYVRLRVCDQGRGISTENIAKVFDPFFTTKSGGSGLGLTSSYWIVRRHDGHIDVESQLDKGTCFTIHLPRARGVPEAEPATPPLVYGTGKILFMDDEAPLREFMHATLTHLGYDIVCSADGAAAVKEYRDAVARGQPFDVAILDLTVRDGLGGQEAVAELRRIDPDILAIVSSGYSNDPVMSNFKAYGFAACIAKPFQTEVLSKLIAGLIEHRRAARANIER